MKQRKIYLSRKRGRLVFEGISGKQHFEIYTIKDAETLLNKIVLNSCILTQEKKQEIIKKINRADFKHQEENKEASKVLI